VRVDYCELTLTFPASLTEVSMVGVSVRSACQLTGCSAEWSSEVELALVEVLNNIVLHGTSKGARQIRVALRAEVECIRLTIWDDGAPLPLGMYAAQEDADERLGDPFAEHGRGVGLIHAIVDTIDVQRVDGWNRVTLTRQRVDPWLIARSA